MITWAPIVIYPTIGAHVIFPATMMQEQTMEKRIDI